MAGLGRMQQRFNVIVASLAALVGFSGHRMSAVDAARSGSGHPIHRKILRSQNVAHLTGRDLAPYQGYCSGLHYNQDGNGKVKESPRNGR